LKACSASNFDIFVSKLRKAQGNAAVDALLTVMDKETEKKTPIPGRVRGRGKQRDALNARYPWGQEGGPPPASLAECQSLADEMARLRKEARNFRRPERGDKERLARAEAMLHIMRDKARVGFGGGRAMATHGLNLNRSAGLALAKRAKKLWLDLEKQFDPEGTPSVLIEEGIAMTYAES